MTRPLLYAGAMTVAVTLVAVAAAQAPMLDVKMGLWETTTKISFANAPAMPKIPDDQLAKMPPEQRAQVESMMKSMQGAPVTTKSCITKDKFLRSGFMEERPNQNCKQEITTNTPRLLEGTVVCTGASAMTVQMRLEASSPTQYKGTMKGKTTTGRGQMDMTADISGKWLGADCGDVK